MNNIHEKDWAEDCWSGHTGMASFSDYSIQGDKNNDVLKNTPEAVIDSNEITKQE